MKQHEQKILKQLESYANIKYKFLHVILDCKRATICIIKQDDKDYYMGISRCSDKDTYNKKLGRAIALGRAYKNLVNCKKLSELDIHEIKIENNFWLFKEDRE
jgi:hypothetical protein